jgi:PilZ domain
MATVQLGGRTALTNSEVDTGRRRAARYPAGWLLVQAETDSDGRKLPGRLLDTSAGGLGLVLDAEVTPGALVRVSAASAIEQQTNDFWHGRQARVAYAVPLPGGNWRVGLTFTTGAQGGLQIWATRLLLLAVFAIAATSAVLSEPAGAIAGSALGAIAVALAIGAERQHWLDTRDANYGAPKASANR